MDASEIKRLKELEEANAKRKRMYMDLALVTQLSGSSALRLFTRLWTNRHPY